MIAKKNILYLLHIPPPIHGSSLVGLRIKESSLINGIFECRFINLLASNNLTESGKVNLRKIINFLITYIHLFRAIVCKRPKLCYMALTSTGAAFYKDLCLVALIRLFRIKRIYHLHNKGVSLHQDKLLNRFCYRFVFSSAEVILLSKYLYPDIQQFVPQSMMHICPNGIADEFPVSKIKNSGSGSKNAVRILFLSNLIESKGVFVLLEACAILKKKEIPFECVFVGGEGDLTAFQFRERVNKLGLSKELTFIGKKYGEEKNNAFAEADIFAFPTYYLNECFPLVLLEAMSYSLSVVSTFEGGIPDIIENGVTGFLVPQRNVAALAAKLELLIQNPELRRQMGAAGRKKYEQEFTQEIFENRLVQILHQVIEKG